MPRAWTLLTLAVVTLSLGACAGGGRAAKPSVDAAAVNQRIDAAVRSIDGVTRNGVGYQLGADGVDSPHAAGIIVCGGCDDAGLRRVLDSALPAVARVLPATDSLTYLDLRVATSFDMSAPAVDARDVGFSSALPRLAEVKEHYKL